MDLFDLSNKTALVTGARRGIGKGIAVGLAKAGADVIAVSASLEEKGSELENEVRACGRKFYGYRADFSKRKSLYAFIHQLQADGHAVDILVNNAGTTMRKSAEQHPDEYWDEVIEVNLNAQFILSREIAKKMIERGAGKIIFIASVLTFQGGITVPGYAASKGGIGQLTKALANDWAAKGINVNAIAPGYIRTDITEPIQNDPKRNTQILDRIPQGRWGEPGDLAGPAIFLASGASDYMNGAIVIVDGGWLGR